MISLGDALLKLGVDPKDLDVALQSTSGKIDKAVSQWKGKFMAAGAALTAVSVAGLKMVDSAREMNAGLKQIAISTGNSEKSLRDLALATTNVTFPLDSVVKTFDLLSRAGVDNATQMQQVSNAFDALADATGSNAEQIAAILLPAYKAFGEELPTTSAQMDKFTWLTKNTTIDLEDFGSVMTYLAPEMDKLGVSMDDTVAILAVLESRGITGAAATRAFRSAVTEAVNEDISLNDALGITQDELATYSAKITETTGLTDEYAEAANTQYGIMDKLKQKLSELTLKYGTALTPLEPLLAATSSLGIVMIALPSAITGASAAIKALGVAAHIAMGPWGLLIAAVGLLAVAIFTNFGGIRDFLTDVWQNKIKPIFDSWLGWFLPGGSLIKGILFFKDNWRSVIDAVGGYIATFVNFFIGAINKIINAANTVAGVFGKKLMEPLKEVSIEFGMVEQGLKNVKDKLKDQAAAAMAAWREEQELKTQTEGATEATEKQGEGVKDAEGKFDKYTESIDRARSALSQMAEEAEESYRAQKTMLKELDRMSVYGYLYNQEAIYTDTTDSVTELTDAEKKAIEENKKYRKENELLSVTVLDAKNNLNNLSDNALAKYNAKMLAAQENTSALALAMGTGLAWIDLPGKLSEGWQAVTEATKKATEAVQMYFSRAGEGQDYSAGAYDEAMAEWQRIADMYASPTFKAGGIAHMGDEPYRITPLPLAPGMSWSGLAAQTPTGVTVVFEGDVYGMDDFDNKVNKAVRDAKVRGGG